MAKKHVHRLTEKELEHTPAPERLEELCFEQGALLQLLEHLDTHLPRNKATSTVRKMTVNRLVVLGNLIQLRFDRWCDRLEVLEEKANGNRD